MTTHRYVLQPFKGMSTRYRCPACNRPGKTLVRYIDTRTGEHLADNVGRCNREVKCGYHYGPKQYFQDNRILGIKRDEGEGRGTRQIQSAIKPQLKAVSFISEEVFERSLKCYEANNFVSFLLRIFGNEITTRLIETYYIGTSKHWPGATVFWQTDRQGKIRTGKIMLYNPATGKRVKEPFNHITWAHSLLKQNEYELKQCFFGEHLLQDKTKPVAIVESEKSAIIASVYLPEFIWLATGGKNGCKWTNLNVNKVLCGRNVTLYPDLNCFNDWSTKAAALSRPYLSGRQVAHVDVDPLLENHAGEAERQQGLDLVDYLLGERKNNWGNQV